jgi:hypothetical protein
MKQILFFLLTGALLFTGCSSSKKLKSSMITQGIAGFVTEASGNQMPMQEGPRPISKGILSTVLIYEPTNTRQVTQVGTSPIYTKISTKQVASVQTDSTGAFKIDLPAGAYSVFVKYGDRFFANLFDQNNNIALFTVETGKLTEVRLVVNVRASY